MNSTIMDFEFTVYIKDLKASDKCIEDRIFEAGCDDALLCSINNDLYLEFARKAQSLDLAIQNALRNIETAGLFSPRF
ncbi:hypothetical protein F994_02667 [Acinetobacter bohemicus ANC 3994]|uniref:Uncharacterized protein n=1 Tax=Acinetobacter bohemicus ANC 3994 TaxID=1217715 RepID=N8QC53_9GAMM|nr:hypothetical protein [Acinetobacter bohemicus]ENU18854.1 hypothetical protein F994_02667 [Acinetobacter bohemicus ANC 3994]